MSDNSASGAETSSVSKLQQTQICLLRTVVFFLLWVIPLIWATEVWIVHYVNPVDRFAYPILYLACLISMGILIFRPQAYSIAALSSVGTFAIYYGIYLQSIVYGYVQDTYNVATFAQWLPLIYISSFIFLHRRFAITISSLVYMSLLLPMLLRIGLHHVPTLNSETFPIFVQMACSHPLYIAALLWMDNMRRFFLQTETQLAAMKIAANIDYLTGIANRRSANQMLQVAIAQAKQSETAIAALLLDIDHFKQINDVHGHDVGDQVLVQVATTLKSNTRTQDILGRWGGEEFLIVLTDTTYVEARQIAERLCTLVSAHDYPPVEQVTASLGGTLLKPEDTVESLVKRADVALYEAKDRGRNQVYMPD